MRYKRVNELVIYRKHYSDLQSLPGWLMGRCFEAERAENRAKNRSSTLLPCTETIVITRTKIITQNNNGQNIHFNIFYHISIELYLTFANLNCPRHLVVFKSIKT